MASVTKRIEPHRRLGLNATPSLQIAQVAGLTAVKGAPVYIDSNGYIAASGTDSVSSNSAVQAAASTSIVGFLQEDGASDSSNTSKVGVTPALPGMMFKGQLLDSSSGSLTASAQTDVGANMGLAVLDGDTHYGVDKGIASSRDCVTVLELIDASGTCGGLVGFVVRAGWRQLDV
jgi:hypothetical protein